MKGLMVTLLVLSCTGMVLAQQEYDNGFQPRSGTSGSTFESNGKSNSPMVPIVRGDSSAGLGAESDSGERARNAFGVPRNTESSSTTSILDSRRPVRDSFPGRSSVPTNRFEKAANKPAGGVDYLGLPDVAVNELLKAGVVETSLTRINPDKITISDRNFAKAGPTARIEPVLRDETLVFTFTEDHLKNIHDFSYEFEVPQFMKGRFNKARIEYPPAIQRVAATKPETGQSSAFHSQDPRWRLAGDTSVRPAGESKKPWENKPEALSESEKQRLAYQEWLKQKEADDKQKLAGENRRLQDELDRMRYEQQQALLRAQMGSYPAGDRYANKNFGVGQNTTALQPRPVVPPSGSDATLVAMLQQNQDRLAQLMQENRTLRNEVQAGKSEQEMRRQFDFRKDGRNELVSNRSGNSKDRLMDDKPVLGERAVLSTGGFGDSRTKAGAGTVANDPAVVSDNNSWKLLMFLMLLCSVGLNLYLWALSRGFYLRYQELADELRETFTATT